MTTSGKTRKEQREAKEIHEVWKARREGKRPPPKERGGKKNLLRAAEQELEEEKDG